MRDYIQMASDDKDMLTSAAKALGTAIGKVSTALHIAEPTVPTPVVKPPAKKRSPQKKVTAKKTAAKKPASKKTATKRRN